MQAQYEDFWMRYGQWLTRQNLLDEAKSAYERAAYKFSPGDRRTAKIALALIQEEESNIEEARSVYTTILESSKEFNQWDEETLSNNYEL